MLPRFLAIYYTLVVQIFDSQEKELFEHHAAETRRLHRSRRALLGFIRGAAKLVGVSVEPDIFAEQGRHIYEVDERTPGDPKPAGGPAPRPCRACGDPSPRCARSPNPAQFPRERPCRTCLDCPPITCLG